jgi:KDO2-lipid IV(A) lauroyltransferase
MARRRKNALLERIEYILYRAIAARARRASDEGLLRWGTRIGNLARRILRSRDRLALRNLRDTFPDKSNDELRRILDECWRHFGREALIYLRMQGIPLDQIAEHCVFVNTRYLEESAARGKGTLILSAHFGGWEVGGLGIMSIVPNVSTVARALDNSLLERDLAAIRERTGAQVVDRRAAARPLMRALMHNEVVVLLPDQSVIPREGAAVPFLGRPAWTTTAPAKMALRTGSTIVFGSCIPDGARHRIEFEEPIRVDQLSEAERDPVVLTARINDIMSRWILERPELWLWMHDRWKGMAESGWDE